MINPSRNISENEIQSLKDALRSAKKIMILCHQNPDGDAIGSALAVYHALKNCGLDAHVGCVDEPPENFSFLPGIKNFVTDFQAEDYDFYWILDCGHHKMVKFHEEKPRILSDKVFKINVDHHPTNDQFGDLNFVWTDSASTTEILYHILTKLDFEITPDIATCLAIGLYTDTGSFMHQNTTPQAYQVASHLTRAGANLPAISKNIFRSYNLPTLRLWGKVLKNLHVTAEGAAIVGVERHDYESLGLQRSDLNGIIDYINSMPEAQYSVLLSEDEKGNVKASLRTRKPEIDVKALAEQYGGGGHVKASGFTIPDSKLQKEVKWKIVTDTEK